MTLLTLLAAKNGGPILNPMFGYSTEPPLDERYRMKKAYVAKI